MPPCTDPSMLPAYSSTNTAASTNQYGDTYTGMPKGRAITIPGWGSRCPDGRSGVMPATLTMLREDGEESAKAARLSVAYPTLPNVGHPQAPPPPAADLDTAPDPGGQDG